MRWKHYLLIALTVLLIAFFQPFIVFLGNLIVIGAALAYVYSDMSPDAQDAYEQKFANWLQRIRHSLRGRGAARAEARLQKRSCMFRLLRRKKVVPASPPVVVEDAIEAEFNLPGGSDSDFGPNASPDASPNASPDASPNSAQNKPRSQPRDATGIKKPYSKKAS